MQIAYETLEDATTDLVARRPEVLRRLIDRGVPAHTLTTILPGWEPFLDVAMREPVAS